MIDNDFKFGMAVLLAVIGLMFATIVAGMAIHAYYARGATRKLQPAVGQGAAVMTGLCPLAQRPDATGCDRDCGLPVPEGFWARILYILAGRSRCTSGIGGCGDGSLPCERLDEYMRRAT